MAPSKNSPEAPLLLSPPVPSRMSASSCIGEYPFGSEPDQVVVRPPLAALPYFRVKLLVPLFFSQALTNG